MSIQTLAELFLETAKFDKPDCLLHKVDGTYRPISTAELVRDVQRLAKALRDAGIQPGDRVALMAENGPHWPTVDFATLCIGAVLVPVYPTLPPDQAGYIVNDSGDRIAFAQGRDRFDGLVGEKGGLPNLEQLVLIPEPGEPVEEGETTLEAMIAAGEGADPEAFEALARQVKEEDLATFIYTSGTTGNPKGVMLTHRNIVTNAVTSVEVLEVGGEYTALSFLPLSHSFERTVDYVYFLRGCTIAYAESVATVGQNLQEVRPHCFVSVPRVYEKVLAKVQENVVTSPPLKQKIFHWAVEVGRKAVPYRLKGETPSGLLGLKLALADKLVFGKIRERLGGRFEFAFSGGAPLAREVAEFFWGAGVPIYEGYGLTETAPVLTANKPGHAKLGTVGRAIPGITLKIAEDGEILAQGPNIMKGYWGLEEATREAIDAAGWFHTGDIGEIDEDGFLRITDRKKELIVNAYGKNIAPAPVENELKASRYIGQAMIIGDRRKFLSALLVPDFETLIPWAEGQGLATEDRLALLHSEAVQKLLQGEVDATNARNAKYERIVKWTALPEEWTVESEEMTPTLKIKRRVITENYHDAIEAMYAEGG
jgi:long-chain acyl-CoA synthetase